MALSLTWSGLAFLIFLLLIFFGLLLGAELGARRFYSILSKTPLGLAQSLRHALELASHRQGPEVVIFQSPVPQAFALRALGGRGTVFLSQGILCQFSESELRLTLKTAVSQLKSRMTPFESACWLVTLLLTSWAPAPWMQLNSSSRKLSRLSEKKLSPFSAIIFWIFYPLLGFFRRLSQARVVDYGQETSALPIRRKMIWTTLLSG